MGVNVPKKYSLKRSEAELLQFVHRQQMAVFSALLSNIAAARLGYQVTENTHYSLNDKMDEVTISESAPAQPNAPPAPGNGGGIRTAT